MHEKCGVAGLIDLRGEENVASKLVEMTHGLQHRGELGAGIALWTRERTLDVVKDLGLVKDVLSDERMAGHAGTAGIGQTWYATCEGRDASNVQPQEVPLPDPENATQISFNGALTNHRQRREALLARGVQLKTGVDTETLAHSIADGLRQSPDDYRGVFRHVESEMDGAFNVGLLNAQGHLLAYRDQHGIHPLSYALVDDRFVAVASEDSAIKRVFPRAYTQDLQPGQLLTVRDGRMRIEQVIEHVRKALCWFEFWYFANHHSVIDGKRVGVARYEAGEHLGAMDRNTGPRKAIVVPVPNSARLSAQGYVDVRHLPYVEAIEKIIPGRTFIAGRAVTCEEKAHLAYRLRPELMRGENVILEDDSIVRATTMRELIKRVRIEGGAKEVHVRVAAPPVLSPCFYGIDFSTVVELFARNNFNGVLQHGELPEEVLTMMAGRLGADSLRYNSVGVVQRILKQCGGLCRACINGCCPTPGGELLRLEAERHACRQS